MEAIGQVLKEFRKEHGMTQKDLSQGICSQSVLSRIENNEEIPNIIVIQQLCHRLGITIDQLMIDFLPEELFLRKYFNKMFMYLRIGKYLEIRTTMEYLEERQITHLDKDRQQAYFFKGVCAYFIDQDPEKALAEVQQGLAIGVSKKCDGYFDSRILLLSFAGKMSSILGRINEAQGYFNQSFELFQTMMADYSERSELSNLFVNYGTFLVKQERLDLAEKVVDMGINWNRQQCSYYKLRELIELKIRFLEARDEIHPIINYRKMLRALEKIKDL
ncbi:helix-turn-helix transcriptional regulator [Enterococcus pseudoavium]|uniref:Helix-turn-helix transcriptional regulator n=1 Tax=Enterococcus pseudoavium TaxID=44007 RepID=A0AAE4I4I8_9ENTE|nr:helix-turn-helix transcriptional regulator [Enterococcus pseudoavium]MDT2737744.1 helix-turn-helix transcriptional regulator [Enterococcus pseudoavium]REC31523.1 transcriptional regulator [Enterococcus pseudoavium]